MKQFNNLIIKRKDNPKKVNYLLSKLAYEIKLDARLRKTQELAKLKIYNKNAFEELKELILGELNDEIRYNLIKVLYINFPEKCISFLSQILMTDYNYNFNIIDFSEEKRYNMNDILNVIIIKKYHRKQMVDDIVNNNLVQFAISWKDYTNIFNIFYDLNLKCFVFFCKKTKDFIYFCSRSNDPFDFIPPQKILKYSDITSKFNVPMRILKIAVKLIRGILNIQDNDLELVILKVKNDEGTPNIKIFNESHDFILYFRSRNELIYED